MNEEKYNLLQQVIETETELNKIIAMLHKNSYELFVMARSMKLKKRNPEPNDLNTISIKLRKIAIQASEIMTRLIDIERELEELLSS